MTKAIKNGIEKYVVRFPQKRKKLDWRDYIIPTKGKKRTNWSERVDEVLYGKKKNAQPKGVIVLTPKAQPEPNIRNYILPMKKGRKKVHINEIDRVAYELD